MKLKKMLIAAITTIMVVLPMNVYAVDFTGAIFGSEDANMTKTTLDGNIKCPKSADGKTATCYLGVKVTAGTAKGFSVDATLTNMSYESNTPMNGWSLKSPTISGTSIKYEFTNTTGAASGSKLLVAAITYKVNNAAVDCSIKITNTTGITESKTCKVEDGKYYCKNGAECTKATYETECTPENPQTGSFVPYVVVIVGLGVAGAFYFITRKKAKIYHV